MEPPNKLLRDALVRAQEKLKLYRALHNGEYVGGMEYNTLMSYIDEALSNKESENGG